MGIISQAADTYYTYRIIRTMVTPWNESDAYKLGIIDENGQVLRKSNSLKTTAEKSAYTVFHRLAFNLKRILEKLPFGKSQLGNFAAALFLIKEETSLSERQLKLVLEKVMESMNLEIDNTITESFWNVIDVDTLAPGAYVLHESIASPMTGEIIGRKGSRVIVPAGCAPVDQLFGTPVYKVRHPSTKTDIFVSPGDIKR